MEVVRVRVKVRATCFVVKGDIRGCCVYGSIAEGGGRGAGQLGLFSVFSDMLQTGAPGGTAAPTKASDCRAASRRKTKGVEESSDELKDFPTKEAENGLPTLRPAGCCEDVSDCTIC